MGVGHQNKKVGAIIQARYDSSRLPGKVLFNLPFHSEETVLSQIIKRLRSCNFLDHIIVATSDQKDDDPLEKEALRCGADIFRGSKDNVLDRYCKAAEKFKIDEIFRVTGDNPILLTDIMRRLLNTHISENNDFTYTTFLPLGTGSSLVNTHALLNSMKHNPDTEEKEHVTLFIKRRKEEMFKVQAVEFTKEDKSDIRLTLDYPSDYGLLNIVVSHLNYYTDYGLNEVMTLFKANPWMKEINYNNYQKKQFTSLQEEKDEAKRVLQSMGFQNLIQ